MSLVQPTLSLVQPTLRVLYRGIRRAAVVDVKRLLHLSAAPLFPACVSSDYTLCSLDAESLDRLLGSGQAPRSIGSAQALVEGRQNCVAVCHDQQLVAYVWLARRWVPAEENFSRSRHLGTSVQLPEGAVFAHTAYTAPEHRGRRLLAGMLGWALQHRVGGAERMFATMDWTNEPSRRAFVHLGFEQVGLIFRLGWGPVQASLVPAAAEPLGLHLCSDRGGIRLAIG